MGTTARKRSPESNASARLEAGPAAAIQSMSRRGLCRFRGFTGTGRAQPNPAKKRRRVPIGSRWRSGLSVKRPMGGSGGIPEAVRGQRVAELVETERK